MGVARLRSVLSMTLIRLVSPFLLLPSGVRVSRATYYSMAPQVTCAYHTDSSNIFEQSRLAGAGVA